MTIGQRVSDSGAPAERAAGIEYQFIARPADVPTEYAASAGTSLRFLAIKAIDNSLVEAALWQPGDRPVTTTPWSSVCTAAAKPFTALPTGFSARSSPPKAMACSASIPGSPARA